MDVLNAVSGRRALMRDVVVIDDDLLDEARRLTGLKETADVMREALRALIERESARRLARLGGTEPDLREIPRRRSETA
jgi:Arc/MetJ family transcription regulator